MKRIPLSKTVRFEVFKRDKFTCQYCGAKAPEAVLHCDHIKPVKEGGTNDIMNLVTACAGCNGGKGARSLDDNSAVEKQRRQLEDLEERRQQIEMMLQWREEVSNHQELIFETINDHLRSETGYGFTEFGKQTVKKWVKQFPLQTILSAISDAVAKYCVWSKGEVTAESWGVAFNKVASFCRSKAKYGDGPEIDGLIYAQGIVRRRLGDKYFHCLDEMMLLFKAGYSVEQIQTVAKKIDDLDEFECWIRSWSGQQ